MKQIGVLLLFIFAICGVARAATPRVVLVFPFDNLSGDSNLGWMSEGIADFLSTRLISPNRYVLERSERDAAYRQLGLSLTAPLTLASEYKVAQTVGADVAIVGTFTVNGGQLVTTAHWFNLAGLKLDPSRTVSGKLEDFDDLETRMAWTLILQDGKKPVAQGEEAFAQRFPSVRLDAFENYIRGVLAADAESRIHFLRESDRLDPKDHRAAFALGRFYFKRKDYSDSARWLAKLVAGDQDYPESVFLAGIDDSYLGRREAAEKDFETLAAEMPLSDVMNNLGVVKASLGDHAGALVDFQSAYEDDQLDPDYAYNLAVSSWAAQKLGDAAKYLRIVLKNDPNDVEAHEFLAQVFAKTGPAADRQKELDWIAEHGTDVNDPDGSGSSADPAASFIPVPRIKTQYDGKAFRLLAVVMRTEAEKKLQNESPEKVQNSGEERLARGMSLMAADHLADAERELSEATALLPKSSEAHRALGEVYEREGKHTLAVTELEMSIKQSDSTDAHLWLARAYLGLGHPSAALKEAQTVLSRDSGNADAAKLAQKINSQLSSAQEKP